MTETPSEALPEVVSFVPKYTEEERKDLHERMDALLSKIFYKYIN